MNWIGAYKAAHAAQHDWLEDVLAGLMINGVKQEEIAICHFQDQPGRVVVTVRGEPKYEHRIVFARNENRT